MQLHNYMEEIVKDNLEIILSKREDICKCERCRFDIIAWALNRLPSKYVVTDKGRMYTKLKEQEIQFRADVINALAQAITYTAKNPRH